ncbi:MAG: hypothetical protein A3G51_02785 [Candidatus Yanofskybacteria bacterium RIFCSPLOWO2_12_FULL_43_11b]|uniref:Uncharacterized protein n=1 Tax=Candidatus Yanofskybacteria bacterium RIFCSPLOWO2_12_FULL_43_11b TaxID=1802710 RepID=A0A1F8H9E3_9BACT|nr:MAG: hypothetical protein A2742_00075 [Candidatus Yanofskybacteria bacterium RIFCSPHIGHO2_01_FULL_43_32]OGN10963.1 MAG: hypothetical protein A3C69_03215 [Candidatus Yanofskybacteria bacterium RIFCSPHIGHO2_02_FULL_43_12]OGN17111.1 MAG: hypothetical protein A3E34_03525 [Candidatus Yanofskybacteria bacterium RIFCSPHIGHO2_12_FULL_43_11]OGN24091.1 MAG: hypothetical protein A2923_02015 [Candidatus Yanofskybacteria bacterium RIFCSPLOWO2_01_FULL_43_46]OGN33579.1 MAG: hypothetical protein A3G51_02785
MSDILYKNKLVAIFLNRLPGGSIPQTEGKEPLQLVTLKHPKGKYLVAHAHKPTKRQTEKMQECLIVKKGKIKADLYGPDKKMFKKVIMKTGDLLLVLNGGIGIHILEDAEILELKNGPFVEDKILI